MSGVGIGRAGGASAEHLASYTRQATILRKNLLEWDRTMKMSGGGGEEWPKLLGRFNAALNQTVTLDRSIDDMMEHFVYLPKKSTANAQDIPFFLSTRLESVPDQQQQQEQQQQQQHSAGGGGGSSGEDATTATTTAAADEISFLELLLGKNVDPVQHLARYETQAAHLASEYEQNMVRF